MGCGASRGASDGGAISIWKPQQRYQFGNLIKDIFCQHIFRYQFGKLRSQDIHLKPLYIT